MREERDWRRQRRPLLRGRDWQAGAASYMAAPGNGIRRSFVGCFAAWHLSGASGDLIDEWGRWVDTGVSVSTVTM